MIFFLWLIFLVFLITLYYFNSYQFYHFHIHFTTIIFINIKDEQFTFTKDFTKHNKEVHEEVKPYKCGKCDKTFRYEAELLRHEPIHAGEKPYKCKSCEASFK